MREMLENWTHAIYCKSPVPKCKRFSGTGHLSISCRETVISTAPGLAMNPIIRNAEVTRMPRHDQIRN